MILQLYRDRRKKKDRPLGVRIISTENSWDVEWLYRQKNKDTNRVEDNWKKQGYYGSFYHAFKNAIDGIIRGLDTEGFEESRRAIDRLADEIRKNLFGKAGDLAAEADVAMSTKRKPKRKKK